MRRRFGLIGTLVALLLVLFVLVPACVWGAFALWYRLPGPLPVRVGAAGALTVMGGAVAASVFGRRPVLALPFCLTFGVILTWWSTIQPVANADWAPDVARQTTGTLNGDE